MKHLFSLVIMLSSLSIFAQKKWTLIECVNHAKENNLTIQQSKINEEFSANDLETANNQWLPSVNGYVDNNLNIGTNHPAIGKGYQQYSNNFGINSAITIYNGGLVHLNQEK